MLKEIYNLALKSNLAPTFVTKVLWLTLQKDIKLIEVSISKMARREEKTGNSDREMP